MEVRAASANAHRPVGEEPWRVVPVQLRADLPPCLDGVEVVAEGAGDDPDLGEAELRRRRHLGGPHVQAGLGAVELVPRHVPHRVLRRRRRAAAPAMQASKIWPSIRADLEIEVLEWYVSA